MSTVAITASSTAPVRTLLQLNIAVLLSFSGIIFACAEGSPLAAATVPIAWMGFLLVDRHAVLRLNVWVANGLGLLMILAVGREFLGDTLESRLLAIGHFLCYLSWILLLQEKGVRQYWFLCALSVLQVATSAVLTNSPWLGLALLAYMTFALFTLSVFSLYRAVSRSAGVEHAARIGTRRNHQQVSVSRNAVRLESAARWLTLRFIAGTAINGFLSILLGLLIFIFTPRVWIGQIESIAGQPLPAARLVSGASEEVQLGDLGQIMENRDLVMEVRFTDMRTDRPITIEEFLAGIGAEAPLFRGVVLDEYQNGRWTSNDTRDSGTPNWSFFNAGNRMFRNSDSHYFRQDIRLRPIGSATLYVGQRAVTCLPGRGRDPITHESLRNTYHREGPGSTLQGESFEYRAYSLAAGEKLPWRTNYLRQNRYLREMELFPAGLAPVRELVRKVARGSDEPPPAEAARRLLTWLRDSGEFGYTLNAAVNDPKVDPIVDFLVNRKQGHCEYFASSLALMLRAVGIPARLVSGFKGGTLNESSGLYEVRQLHAHAWVEAYVDEDWVVLDPTPAARDETVAATAATSHFWVDLVTWVRDLWAMGMMLTGNQQQRMLFTPLQRSASGLLRSFTDMGSELSTGFFSDSAAGEGGDAVMGLVLIALAALVLLVSGAAVGLRLLGRRSGCTRGRRRSGAGVTGPPVPFYERFCSILARKGYARAAAQTQREFAGALRRGWKSNGSAVPIDDFPDVVTAAFYRVRFGDHPLPAAELHTLNSSLDRFEQSLNTGTAENGRSR